MTGFVELLPPDRANPDTARWYELRRQGVTASEIPVILGLSTWDSPWSLWHRKRGLIPDEPAGESADWGRRLEPAIADAFAQQHPELMLYPAGLYASRERPWQMATPDRLATDGPGDDIGSRLLGLVELKHPYSWHGWGDEGTDDVPPAYMAQCLWQLDVMDLDLCRLAAYTRHQMRVYQIRRDVEGADADLEMMRQRAQEFLTMDEPPPLDHHPATLRAVKALHPDLEDRDQILPDGVAGDYTAACMAVRAADDRKRQAEAALRLALGPARYGLTTELDPVVTRSIYERRMLHAVGLRRDHPDIAAKYTATSTVDKLTPARKDTTDD